MRGIALASVVAAVLGAASGAQAKTLTVTESHPAVARAVGATVSVSLGPERIVVRAKAKHRLRAVVTEQRRGKRARRVSLRPSRSKPRTLVLARSRSLPQRILLRLRVPGTRAREFRIEIPVGRGEASPGGPGETAPAPAAPVGEQPPALAPPLPAPDPAEPAAPAAPDPETPAPPDPIAQPARDRLSWEQPALTAPTDVYVSSVNRALILDPARDYVIHMPVLPLSVSGGLTISGGDDVVLVGGRISIPWQGSNIQWQERRGLFLKNQRGTIHVEGLLIDGPDVSEGINLDEGYGATVQLENVRVEGLHARDEVHFSDTHPDVIQTWNGPDRLLVDRLTGGSDYQGFFLRPQEKGGPAPTLFAFRNVNLIGTDTAGNLLWKGSEFPIETSDTWVSPNPHKTINATLWPSPAAWPGVKKGLPPSGDFVAAGEAGSVYTSPGFTALAGTQCHYVSTVGPGTAPRHCE